MDPGDQNEDLKKALFGDTPASFRTLRAASRQQSDLANLDLKRIAEELSGESDRAAIILASSILDDALSFRLNESFRMKLDEGKEWSDILGPSGILNTFAKKLKIAALTGAIESATYTQLNAIRELRNACAHSTTPVTFQDLAVKNVLRHLLGPSAFYPLKPTKGDVFEKKDEAKGLFVLEALHLLVALLCGSRENAKKITLATIGTVALVAVAVAALSHIADRFPKKT